MDSSEKSQRISIIKQHLMAQQSCIPKTHKRSKEPGPRKENKSKRAYQGARHPPNYGALNVNQASRNLLLNALYKKNDSQPEEITSTVPSLPEIDKESSSSTLKPSDVLPMQIVEVEVTHVDSPSCFYVQKLIEYGKLSLIFEEINVVSLTLDSPPASKVTIGACFLGKFSRDGNFYRAKIIHIGENGEILVKYIDYGNSEVLTISSLRPCPKKYDLDSIPPYEISCCLWGVEPWGENGWTDEAINLFIELVTGRKLNMCILNVTPSQDSTMCQVNIMRPACVDNYFSLPIGEVLIYFKYASAVEGNSSTLEMDAPLNLSYNIPDVNINIDPVDATVSHIESPSHFYVELMSMKLKSEMINIQARYHSVDVKSSDWSIYLPKIGMSCCVKSARDTRWHRAVIESENGPSEITVHFVDTGEVQVVTYQEIKKLDKKFTLLPAQAIKCKLKDIVAILGGDKWTPDSIVMLKTIVERRNVKVIFHSKEKDLYEVSLRIHNGAEDISQILVDNNHGYIEKKKIDSFFLATAVELLNINGLEDSTFPSSRRNLLMSGRRGQEQVKQKIKELSSLGETLSKFDRTNQGVKHFVIYLDITSLNAIHIRFTSQQEKFMQIINDLEQINITKSKKFNYQPKVGDMCMIVLEEKKMRARVKVLSVSSNSVKGHLADIGGIQTIPKSSLISLHPTSSLFTHSSLSTVVTLADVLPTGGIEEWSNTACDFARDVLGSACDLFIVRKGKIFKDPDLDNIKVLPVELGWIHKSSCPFEEKTEFHSSLNEILVERGLALPIRNKQIKLPVSEKIFLSSSQPPKISEAGSNIINRSREPSESSSLGDSAQERNLFSKGAYSLTNRISNDNDKAFLNPVLKLDAPKFDLIQMLQKAKSSEIPPDSVNSGGWKPPEPLTESIFLAKVTNVDMLACVSLHPITEDAKLNEMITVHEYEFKNSQTNDSDLCWNIGDPVVARYFQDSKWYRATILELREDRKVHVEFIDYGNTDTLPVKDIRTKVTYMNTPVQSYKCILDGIVPNSPTGWQVEQLDFLHKLIVDKICRVTLVNPYKTGVKQKIVLEIYETKTNVTSILVDTKICKYKKKPQCSKEGKVPFVHGPPTVSEKASDVVIEEDVTVSDIGEPSSSLPSLIGACNAVNFMDLTTLLPHFPLPNEGDTLPINVSAIEIDDPSRIFISLEPFNDEDSSSQSESTFGEENLSRPSLYQKISCLYASHKDMMALVQENIASYPLVTNPVAGSLCLAFFMETKIWHRALILNVEDFEVEVLFIDYGNRETIDKKWLREAPPECFLVPTKCLLVKLHGIDPPRDSGGIWSEEAMKEMLDCLFYTKREFFAFFTSLDELPEINLLIEDNHGICPLSNYHFKNPEYFSFL